MNAASGLDGLLGAYGTAVEGHAPWPRRRVEHMGWIAVCDLLEQGKADLLALWADDAEVHMALYGLDSAPTVVSLAVEGGEYPSVSRRHLPSLRLERAIADLYGHKPVGLPDPRPWLDHGRWPNSSAKAAEPYPFLPVKGEGVHQIPVGPVHAGIIEPGHFRFTANGETVVRLEERLGYVHKGVERLMQGASLADGARLCGRVSGDSTVAYAVAFSRAAEAALGFDAPERAHALRGVMAELERIANHIGDIGGVCNDAAFAIMLAHCGALRERVLRAADVCFGHRLMMDRVVPGGVTADLSPRGEDAIAELLIRFDAELPRLMEVYDDAASLKERTSTTGILSADLTRRFAAGGVVGRASGRDFDARRDLAYPPYDRLEFAVPVLAAGDVNARVWLRFEEIRESIRLIRQIVAEMPQGPLLTPPPPAADGVREGCGIAESFRGEVFVWLRLDAQTRILRCHPRDPSWFQWPLLEAAIEGNIVADFPLCNKSFNCSYSGHDL